MLPIKDGGWWVLAYGSNELLRLTVNGLIVSRRRLPLNGFDRPIYIIEPLYGRLLVSVSSCDRISLFSSN